MVIYNKVPKIDEGMDCFLDVGAVFGNTLVQKYNRPILNNNSNNTLIIN